MLVPVIIVVVFLAMVLLVNCIFLWIALGETGSLQKDIDKHLVRIVSLESTVRGLRDKVKLQQDALEAVRTMAEQLQSSKQDI